MKEQLALHMKGRVTFSLLDFRGVPLDIKTRKNAIQVAAKDIAAKRLIADGSSVIDTIAIYNGINLLVSKPIDSTAIIGTAEVQFNATFNPTDFSGPFTEARLIASGIGAFSIIQNLVDSKLITESLIVSWTIQIV